MIKYLLNGKTFLLSIVLLLFSLETTSQNKIPKDYCISLDEMNLFNQINSLRSSYDKPKLKLSASLSYVAHTHVNDLQNNRPDTSICGLSSWSDKGNWKACCYNTYVFDEKCMWDKPKELTSYPYRGYELVMYFEDPLISDSIINIWSGARKVLDMIMTNGDYQPKKWVCMGIGINEHYASVWFGQRNDVVARPPVCDTNTAAVYAGSKKPADTISRGFFYLIFGSFDQMKDAKEALKPIKKNGFPESGILTKDDRYRIYLGKYDNIKTATFAKQGLPDDYKEAWILKY